MAKAAAGRSAKAQSSASKKAAQKKPASKASKPRRADAKKAGAAASAAPDTPTIDSLLVEIENLRDELTAAHERIYDLERRRDDVLNRIDWILDSLKTAQNPTTKR